MEQIAREMPGVKHTVAIAGQSLLLGANAPNFGAMYVMLDEFHHRPRPELAGDAIGAELAKPAAAARSPKGGSTCSAPRRWMGWARPAVSKW